MKSLGKVVFDELGNFQRYSEFEKNYLNVK